MYHHYSFVFDRELTDEIHRLQAAISGVLSNRHEQSPFISPHMTAAQCDIIPDNILIDTMKKLSEKHSVISLTIDTVSFFPENGIILTPIPTRMLLQVHEELISKIGEIVTVPNWLLPDNWMPHIGLVSRYKIADVRGIIEFLSRNPVRMRGEIIGIYIDDQRLSDTVQKDRLFLFRREAH